MQAAIDNPAMDEDPSVVTVPVIVETVNTVAGALAATIEQSCLTVCQEFAVIGRALELLSPKTPAEAKQLLAARESFRTIMVAMQFQDRHNQTMQDIAVMLRYLRQLSGTRAALPLEASCERLQLREIRDVLRLTATRAQSQTQTGRVVQTPLRTNNPAGSVELF